MKKIKRVMKKIPKKIITLIMLTAVIFSYISPITNVLAVTVHGEGDKFITANLNNNLGFTVNNKTINADNWNNTEDEFHTTNDKYHIIISVSGNQTTGDKVPQIQYGGNWSDYMDEATFVEGNNYQFVLDIDISGVVGAARDNLSFLDLSIVEKVQNQNPQPEQDDNPNPGTGGVEPGPEPGESYFDGKAYVVWSCGSGVCYHYFDNIPAFDDGNSTFYKDTEVTADNKEGETFDVHAKYMGWYLKDTFDEWKNLYEVATGKTLNWDTMDPELILGEPNQLIRELEESAIAANACVKPDEDAPREDQDEFESCIHLYAAQHDHKIWTHKLQPVGEPTANNAYVSYGDRNFKVVIYSNKYKGVTMGDLSDLHYYPSRWTNPFLRTDQYDISDTTKEKPALMDSILLESTVKIKSLGYNSFEIASIEALDVPKEAVKITKKE